MPVNPVLVWTNQVLQPAFRPELAVEMPVALVPADTGLTVHYARGTVLGRQTETGLYGIYNPEADDGTEIAVGLLMYDVTVDDAGQMAMTAGPAAINEFGQQQQNVGLWVAGYFQCVDLLQSGPGSLDANARTDLAGRFLNGDLTNGVFKF